MDQLYVHTKENIPLPAEKYGGLPLDKNGYLLDYLLVLSKTDAMTAISQYLTHTLDGDIVSEILSGKGLSRNYYTCEVSDYDLDSLVIEFHIKGHYTCPP